MAIEQERAEMSERDGKLVGPYRRPRNLAAEVRGSIHDDSTAQKLGFRGGTVAGSIHMEQFPPLMLAAFGQRWFETGSLSCYFRFATMGDEAVRGSVQVPPDGGADAQVKVWMERDDGTLVMEGTASVGTPAEPSMVQRKLAEPRNKGELRMLAHLVPGSEVAPVTTSLTWKVARPRLDAITEPLPWYEGDSPWGGAVVNPGLLVHMMTQGQLHMDLGRAKAVGLYGAIEIRHLAGPVFMEREYQVLPRILDVCDTPKTEYVWYETLMRDGAGKDVASMIMMLRFMKASSPLWQ